MLFSRAVARVRRSLHDLASTTSASRRHALQASEPGATRTTQHGNRARETDSSAGKRAPSNEAAATMTARRLRFLALAGLLAACAHSYRAEYSSGAQGAPLLPEEARILVGVSLDARERDLGYMDSGLITTDRILEALDRYTGEARAAESAESLEQYIDQARARELDYVIFPEILVWSDRNTQRYGFPDQLELRLTLVDARTKDVLDTATVSATSRKTPSWNDRPEDLLPGALERYASRMFTGR
jgi:Domain of unknown function (DUF4823)